MGFSSLFRVLPGELDLYGWFQLCPRTPPPPPKLTVAKPLSPGQLSLATFRLPFPVLSGQVHRTVFRNLHPSTPSHRELTPSRSAAPADRHLKWYLCPRKGQAEKLLECLLSLPKHALYFYSHSLTGTCTTGVACSATTLPGLVPAAVSHSYYPCLSSTHLTTSFPSLKAPNYS